MNRLTFGNAKAEAFTFGVILERKGRGQGYEYWNAKEGGGTIGEAPTLAEAWVDLQDFKDKPEAPKGLDKRALLSDLIKEVDYDIWKGMFVSPEEPEENEAQIKRLEQILDSHLP